jgi:hypothetical protein
MRWKGRQQQQAGRPVVLVPGFDGFWVHRMLKAKGFGKHHHESQRDR